MSRPAVFLDRDGTLTVGTPTIDRVDSVEKVQLLPDTLAALQQLAQLDYAIFIVTNQAGIAEGLIDWADFAAINARVLELLAPSTIDVEATYVCPHGEHDDCDCRKPKPKLLLDAAQEHDLDLSRSWMVGDRPTDVQTGINAGTKTILVKTGDPQANAPEATYTANTLLDAVRFIAS